MSRLTRRAGGQDRSHREDAREKRRQPHAQHAEASGRRRVPRGARPGPGAHGAVWA
jgi:hypothetical protein